MILENINKLKAYISNENLFKDSFWALTGSVASRGLGLFAAIIIARILGKDVYGEFGIIRNTLLSVAIFSTFGLGYTATKFISEYKKEKKEHIKSINKYINKITLVTSLIMAFILFISSDFISSTLLNASHLASSLKIVSFWVVFNALTTTQIGVLAGFNEFKRMAKINTIVGVFTFFLSVVFTFYFLLKGALIALLISQILNWYLNFRLVSELTNQFPSIEKYKEQIFINIIKFSAPVALQEALYSITSWCNYLLLIKYTTYGEMGLYSAANQWSGVILFIPGILRNVILSHMSNSGDDIHRYNRILHKMLKINFFSTIIPVLIIFIFSNIITSFYGDNFDGLNAILNISIFSTIFISLSNVYVQAYMSKGYNWPMFWMKFFYQLGIIFIFYILLYVNENKNGAIYLSLSTLLLSALFLFFNVLYYDFKYHKGHLKNLF